MASTDQDATAARADLRAEQQRWAGPGTRPRLDALGAALGFAAQRRQQQRIDGDVFDGWFRYSAQGEEARWARTEAVIRRVDPGPFEDPRYVEMLARQAASIEILAPGPDGTPGQYPVLLGTTGEARNHAFSALRHGYVLVLLSAGMIDCMYQMAKCVALAMVEVDKPDRGGVTLSADLEKVAAHLRADSTAVDLMADNLTAWLYEGTPRSPTSRVPPARLHGAIQLLIDGAERFVIAHEYAHAFLDLLSRADPLPPHECELRADGVAVRLTRDSSQILDRLPPNIGLQGAVLAMKANQLTDQALSIAQHGEVVPAESFTHPPFATRLAQLEEFYLNQHEDPEHGRDELRGMQVPAMLGDLVFETVQPRLQAMFRSGRRLHPIWG
jgi:hypothetical protein